MECFNIGVFFRSSYMGKFDLLRQSVKLFDIIGYELRSVIISDGDALYTKSTIDPSENIYHIHLSNTLLEDLLDGYSSKNIKNGKQIIISGFSGNPNIFYVQTKVLQGADGFDFS